MKGKIIQWALAACFFMGSFQPAFADRGDLVSYELLEYFESEDVVNFFSSYFSNYIDPEEDPAFYNLATAFFGQLINERNISVYKTVYETIDFYDAPAIASGIVLVPGHDSYDCTKSFSLYAHGTVFAREGVNSRPSNWGGEFMLTLMMASINTICVAPDYYGLGDGDGFHHHSHYKTNANSSLDAVRAGRNLCDILGVNYNDRLLPMGYSEGGHASMSIGKMVREEQLQNEFSIPFIGAGSGAYDMSGEALNFILGNPLYPTRQYILYQLASCEDMYGDLIIEEEGETYNTYLISPYDELFEQHVFGQTGHMGWVPQYWRTMFQPGVIDEVEQDMDHPLRTCLERSNVYDWFNTTPTLMYFCTTDEQVPYTGAIKTRDVQRSLLPWYLFWQRFKIQALDLTLGNTIPDHGTCALPSIFVQLIFMNQSLGLSCEYTGRSLRPDALHATDGAQLDGRMIYSGKILDVHRIRERSAGVTDLEVLNLQTGDRFNSKEGGHRYEFRDNGLYIVRLGNADGTHAYSWVYKAEPDFVSTEDYNPLASFAEKHYSELDISLLPETVLAVRVTDSDGALWISVNAPQGDRIRLDWPAQMPAGEYLVEVQTAQGNYPLAMQVERKAPASEAVKVYPNPVQDQATMELGDCPRTTGQVTLYNAGGTRISSAVQSLSDCRVTLATEHLTPGIYHMEVHFPDGRQVRGEFVKP